MTLFEGISAILYGKILKKEGFTYKSTLREKLIISWHEVTICILFLV